MTAWVIHWKVERTLDEMVAHSRVSVSWAVQQDVATVPSLPLLRDIVADVHRDKKDRSVEAFASQLWHFCHDISLQDLIVTPHGGGVKRVGRG